MRNLVLLAVLAAAFLAVLVQSKEDNRYWGTQEGKTIQVQHLKFESILSFSVSLCRKRSDHQ